MKYLPKCKQGNGKIGKGAVVRLRSGGPMMTVTRVTDKGRAECVFFDDTGHVDGVKLPTECLNVEFPAERVKEHQRITRINEKTYGLPDHWKNLHWVQKEKFIKTVDDCRLIKRIMRFETIKPLIKACKKRLKDLA